MTRGATSWTGLAACCCAFVIGGWFAIAGGAATAQNDVPQAVATASTQDADRFYLSAADLESASVAHLVPEDTKSLLAQGAMEYGQFAWDDSEIPSGEVQVWVDLRRQTVSVFRGGHEIGTAIILYGKPGKDTPLGTFSVLRKVADYHSRSYDAPMPHSLFITNDGVALHGSDVGYGRATHGCIGLPPEFAKLLFDEASTGTKVTVVYSDAGATEKLASN